jgi:hypothetical protein
LRAVLAVARTARACLPRSGVLLRSGEARWSAFDSKVRARHVARRRWRRRRRRRRRRLEGESDGASGDSVDGIIVIR